MAKIQGGDLMLFIGGKSIAYATNHTLEISGDTTDTSNKDEGGGKWGSQEVSKINWTVSSENLYSVDGEGENFDDLFDAMVNGTELTAVFSVKSGNTTEVPDGGWTPGNTSTKYTGKLIVNSLSLNAPNGEYATFTANFTGVGALTSSKPA
jgi:TP901-1 family phage major tail protein